MTRVALAWLVLLAPLRSYALFAGSSVTLSPYRLALAALVGIFVIGVVAGRERVRLNSDAAGLALLLGMYESSLLVSLALGAPEVGDSWTRVFVKAFGFVVVGLFMAVLQSRDRILLAHRAYLWSAMIPIVGAIFQEVGFVLTGGIPPLPLSLAQSEDSIAVGTLFRGLPRVSSTLLEPNYFGMFCAACALLSIARMCFLLREGRRFQPGWFLISVGSTLGVILSLSLSAMVGLAVGLATLGLILRVRSRIVAVVVGIVLATLGVAEVGFSMAGAGFGILELLGERMGGRLESTDLFDRREFFEAGLRAFSDHPILGAGIGGIASPAGVSTAHSSFLTVLGEQGVFGFCAVASIYAVILILATKRARQCLRDGDVEMACTGAALVAGLVALCAATLMYDALFSFDSSWTLLGIAAAYAVNGGYWHQAGLQPS